MSLATGDKFGSYEILALIGKGGMGEVYRARDSKLKRDVAVKVLPEVFACDSGRMDRFEREAEVLASLNHQNIAHIYGVEDRALIMELAEGESPRGPLPFDEAWKIASQIADALAYAHEKGVVHRDLKPANIKVAPDGTVKLLDFGLAKAFTGTPDSASAEPANSPTLTMGATVAGVILGTAGYMSPEQARGKNVDRRADIWAFGVVLYELLTGKRLFQGEDLTDTLASVVKVQPDLSPAPVEACRLLQACLEKDPKKRLQAIGDARYLIGDAAPVEHRRKGTVTAWIAAGAVAVALGVALWASWRAAAPAAGIVRLTMETSPAERLGPMSRGRPAAGSMALSPDGNTLVFAGERQTGQNQKIQRLLYKRSLDQSAATPIAGTDDAYAPFFSPDGEWVGFFTGGLAIGGSSTLKKIPMAGGPATVICDLPETPSVRGASWGTADQIVFAGRDRGLLQVPASGGTPQRLFKTDPANSSFDVSPWFLPDGKTLLFTERPSNDWREAQIMARRVDTGEQHALVKGGADPRYVRTGHLLYLVNGVLMAVPFDAQNAQVSGKPVALIDGVMQSVNMTNGGLESGIGQVAISPSGNLVYALGGIFPGVPATIVRMDRKGVQTELGAPKGLYVGLRVSPDGRRLGSFRGADNSRQRDIWVLDMSTGNATRVTSDGSSSNAVWSTDGKRLFYRAGDGGRQIRSIAADGSGAPETILTGEGVWPAR
jgi:serine/threonine-protein kinase